MSDKNKNLIINDLKPGNGDSIAEGDRVVLRFNTWLYDPKSDDLKGTLVQTSDDLNSPLVVSIGYGALIDAWEEGIPGMRVGGKRQLIAPPSKAYGVRGIEGRVPGRANVVMEIDLVERIPSKLD